jgi:hypothetical protein
LGLLETEIAIKKIKDFFQDNLADALNLTRVSAPLFVNPKTGLNDDLIDNSNVGIGYQALQSNESGKYNIAIGYKSLFSNVIGGDYSISVGHESLFNNTIGRFNIAIGHQSLYSNIEGRYNIAIGDHSLLNVMSYFNIGFGSYALSNTLNISILDHLIKSEISITEMDIT